MKRIISLLLVVVMLCSTFAGLQISSSARTSSGSCGNGVTYTFDESTGLLTISGNGTMDDYDMNSPFEELGIESVLIHSGVTSIGEFAFAWCESLTSITIPDSITSIGDYAFYGCSSLTGITIPNSVTSIGKWAFEDCSSLTGITIPNSVTSIGDYAFYGCSGLTSISIPASVTSIGSYAFEGSYELTDVYYEGTEAEWNEIDIDDSNESLLAANIHFEEYPNPDSDPDPEPEYEYIEHGFLPVNSDSVSVNLAEYEIHQFFIENPGEYEITISGENECDASLFYIKGNGSEYIDRRYGNDITLIFSAKEDMFDVGVWLALEGEGNVEVTCRTIKAPTSIKYTPVQEYVLLQEAGSGWYNTTPYDDEQGNLNSVDTSYYYNLENYSSGGFASGDKLTLEYEDGTSVTYTFAENHGWQDDDENIFTGYLEMKDNQNSKPWTVGSDNYFWFEFLGVKSNLIPVTILENKELDSNYKYNDGVIVRYTGSDTEVTVPATLGNHKIFEIDSYAFALNKDIISVTLPDSVCDIYGDAFRNCTNLENIYFSYDLEYIGGDAFSGCDNLKDVYFYGTEDDWNNIEISEGNESLQNATVHFLFNNENLCGGHINYAFDETTGILTLTGRGTTYDYSSGEDIFSPFYNNDKIKKVIVSEGVNYIGQDLFYGCSNLKEISLPSTLCALGQGCFWGCSSLESITIPYSVTFIGYYAFTDCTALKDIYYAGSESDWNEIEIGEENENLLNANIHFDFEQTHKHEYVSTVTTPATCTEPGVMTYICACGETYTDVIPATGHKSVVLNSVEPTCTKTGLTEGEKCSVCGEILKAQKTLKALGHNWGEWSVTKAATCETAGTETRVCANDASHTETRTIAKIDHTPAAAVRENVKAATCTVAGSYDSVVKCSVCSVEISRIKQTIPATGHKYSVKEVKPTATALGYTLHTCSGCGKSYKDAYTAPTGKQAIKCKARTATAQTVYWNNVKTATGYQVQISTKDGKKWSTYATLKAGVTSYTFKNLAAGNNYKFRVRFHINAADGKNYFSPWSATLNSPTLPAGTTITKLTPAKRAFVAQWKKQAVSGYQVQYSLKANFEGAKTITIKNANQLKTTVSKLNAGKYYFVRIRTYKTIAKANYCSAWSKAYKVKTK